MSSSLQDKQIALQNAEKALRVAENYIYTNLDTTSNYDNACLAGLCNPNLTTSVWNSINWDNDTTHTFQLSGADTIPNTITQPKYIIELMDNIANSQGESSKLMGNKKLGVVFRITTVGWGNRSGTNVMLQSVYVKK
jgi:type IV pilus assembly protein PilX